MPGLQFDIVIVNILTKWNIFLILYSLIKIKKILTDGDLQTLLFVLSEITEGETITFQWFVKLFFSLLSFVDSLKKFIDSFLIKLSLSLNRDEPQWILFKAKKNRSACVCVFLKHRCERKKRRAKNKFNNNVSSSNACFYPSNSPKPPNILNINSCKMLNAKCSKSLHFRSWKLRIFCILLDKWQNNFFDYQNCCRETFCPSINPFSSG